MAVAAVLVAGGLAGCGDDGPAAASSTSATAAASTATAPTPTASTPTATAPVPVTAATTAQDVAGLYFMSADGTLMREEREVPAGDPLQEAARAMLDGPTDPSLAAAVPAGTRILDLSRDGGVVTVDFSGEFESGYPSGGAAAEAAIVGAVVRTLAEAGDATAVRILVEGRVPAPAGSQYDWSQPFTPDDTGATAG